MTTHIFGKHKKLIRNFSVLLTFSMMLTLLPIFEFKTAAAGEDKNLIAYYDFGSANIPSNLANSGVSVNLTRATNGASTTYGTISNPGYNTDLTYQQWDGNTSRPGYQYKMEINKNITDSYTIALKFSFLQTHSGTSEGGVTANSWRKIIDYQNFTQDSGFYFHNGFLEFFSDRTDTTTEIFSNEVVELIVTRNGANNTFVVYLIKNNSGTPVAKEVFHFTDTNGYTKPIYTGSKTILGFFADDNNGNEYSSGGKVFNIKVWGYCMTQAEASVAAQPLTVSYSGNGVSLSGSAYNSVTYNVGNTATVAAAPSSVRSGCHFKGWRANDGTLYQPGNTFSVQSATTLTAQWEPNAPSMTTSAGFNIAYDGYSHGMSITPTLVSGLSYTYQWYGGGTTEAYRITGATGTSYSISNVNQTSTYYCKMTATCGSYSTSTFSSAVDARINAKLTFDSQGGSAVSAISNIPYNTAVTLPAPPSKTGYKFGGWFTQTNGAGSQLTASTAVTANTTYYVKWTPITYSVVFNPGSGGSGTMPNQTHTYDSSLGLSSNAFKKVGYSFVRWAQNADGTGTTYTNGQSVKNLSTVNGDSISLYAQWSPNTNTLYSVKHIKQNVDGTYPTTTTDVDNLTGTSDATVTPAVRTFTGFTSPEASSLKILPNGTAVKTYQYSRNNYNLTWDKNGGDDFTGTYTSGNTPFDAPISAPSSPTRTGYTFSKWNTTVAAKMPANDLSYTALWTPNPNTKYKVEHYKQQLNGTYLDTPDYTDNLTGTTDTNVTPAVKSYTGFTSPTLKTENIEPDGSRVIKYYYQRNLYSLTWITSGEPLLGDYTKGDGEGKVLFGTSIIAPTTPEKIGFTFDSWNPTVASTMPANDVTHTALWTPNPDTAYTVNHFKQQLDGTYNSEEPDDTDNLTGTTDTNVTPDVKTYEGFTSPDTSVLNILPNGSAIKNYEYTRNSYELTWNTDGDELIGDFTTGSTLFETPIVEPVPTKDGFIFTGWDSEAPDAMPAEDLEFTATWIPVGTTDAEIETTLDTPPEVEGLADEEQFVAAEPDRGFTKEELDSVVTDGASLKLELSVNEVPTDSEKITDKEESKNMLMLTNAAHGAGFNTKYALNLTVDKYIKAYGDEEYTKVGNLIELPSVISVKIKVPDGIDLEKIAIWRNHEGEVTRLAHVNTANGKDGTFTVNAQKREVTIYTKYFSLYVIGEEIPEEVANTADTSSDAAAVLVTLATICTAGYLVSRKRRKIDLY